MDPVTAFSLACGVVQMIQAGIQTIKICHQIYAIGASGHNQRLTSATQKLVTASNGVGELLTAPIGPLTKEDSELHDLANKVTVIADELAKELQQVTRVDGDRKRDVAVKTVKTFTNKGRIDELHLSLQEYREVLDTTMLVRLSHRYDIQSLLQQELFLNLKQEVQLFILSLSQGITSVAGLITAEAEKTRIQIENSLQKWQQNVDADAAVSRIISSLSFPDMYSRQNQIKSAHAKTFRWVFKTQVARPWNDFVQWIHQGTSPYWVLGKPGCGKSTFMKFLASHPDTTSHMKDLCGGPGDPHVLSFYFWSIGSTLQKTTTGLLLTLLHQLLQHEREILKTLVKNQKGLGEKLTINDWSLLELENLLESVSKATGRSVCIFIDGLDEFDISSDDIDDLLELLERMNSWPRTRICASSRPVQLFIDVFGHFPKLKLQDLTRHDIESYVRDTLDQRLKSRRLSNIYDSRDVDFFTEAVTLRAEGVFLWVAVALKRILQSLTDRLDLETLHKQLNELPKDIEDLYSHMWERLNENTRAYRDEAATFFTYILLRSETGIDGGGDPSVFELMVATDKEVRDCYLEDGTLMTSEELVARCEITKVRLLTRCAGLLEVFDTSEGPGLRHYLSSTKVTLVHSTVREFLLETHFGHDILANCCLTGSEVKVKSLEARLVSVLHGIQHLDTGMLFKLLDVVEKYGGSETIEFLSLIEQAGQLSQLREGARATADDWSHQFISPQAFGNKTAFMAMDFLGLTAELGFDHYVSHRLNSTGLHFTRRYKDYFLLCASTMFLYYDHSSLRKIRTLELVLQHGADVNAHFFLAGIGPLRITPWTNLLAAGRHQKRGKLLNRTQECVDASAFWEAVRLFVEHGAAFPVDLLTFHFPAEDPFPYDSLEAGCSDTTWLRFSRVNTAEPSDSDRICLIRQSKTTLMSILGEHFCADYYQDVVSILGEHVCADNQDLVVHVQYGPRGFRVDDPADATDLLNASRALAPWLYMENNTPFPGNICAAQDDLETKVREIQDRSIQQDAFEFLIGRGWIKFLDDNEVLHHAPPMLYASVPSTPDLFQEPEDHPITSSMATLTTEVGRFAHTADIEQLDQRRQSTQDTQFFDAVEAWI